MKKHLIMMLSVAALATGCSDPAAPPLRVEDASVETLQAVLRDGRMRCRDVTLQSLQRIEALNRQGPALRAVLQVSPDALALADALDGAQARGEPLGPLHCVPLLVKDNFNTGDRMVTGAGSLVMDGFLAPADASAVARLRAAGALPLAKTHMDEWAMGAAGYGSRGGQMLNPHRLNRQPGGSSGGSAIGVATGMGLLATGSDTGGSIRIPAALNGVVGIKPTLGLVGRSGMIPSSSMLDVAGPIARNVADAALMLGVIARPDADDPGSLDPGRPPVTDYRGALVADGLRGARLGVLASFHGVRLSGENADVDAALAEALALMAARGAMVQPGVAVPSIGSDDELLDALGTLAVAKFREEINGYFNRYRPPGLRSLDDLMARAHALGSTVVLNLAALRTAANAVDDSRRWASAMDTRTRLREAVLAAMDRAGVDALVFPTMLCPATPLPGVVDGSYRCAEADPMPLPFGKAYGGGAVIMASMTGLPEITVPAGFTRDGLPVGLSFFGRPFSEATLIRLAYAYEQASAKRRAPAMNP